MKEYIKPDFIIMDDVAEGVHSATSEFNFERVCEDQTQVRMKYFWTDAKATDGKGYGGNNTHVHTTDCQGNEEHIGNHVSAEQNWRNVMQGELFISTNQMEQDQDTLTIKVPLGSGFTYSQDGAYRYEMINGKLEYVQISDGVDIKIVNDEYMVVTLQNVSQNDNIAIKMGALSTDTYSPKSFDEDGRFNFATNGELPDPLKGQQVEVMSSTGAVAGTSTLAGGHANFNLDYYMEHGRFDDALAQSYADSQYGKADWQTDATDSHGTQVGYGYNAMKYQFTYSYDTEFEWASKDENGNYDFSNMTKDTEFKYNIKESKFDIEKDEDGNITWKERPVIDDKTGLATENKGNMANLNEVIENIKTNAVGKGFTEDLVNSYYDKANNLGANADFAKELEELAKAEGSVNNPPAAQAASPTVNDNQDINQSGSSGSGAEQENVNEFFNLVEDVNPIPEVVPDPVFTDAPDADNSASDIIIENAPVNDVPPVIEMPVIDTPVDITPVIDDGPTVSGN